MPRHETFPPDERRRRALESLVTAYLEEHPDWTLELAAEKALETYRLMKRERQNWSNNRKRHARLIQRYFDDHDDAYSPDDPMAGEGVFDDEP